MSLRSLTRQTVRNKSISGSIAGLSLGTRISAPIITSIIICDSSYNNLDDTALDSAGSYVKIIGTGFQNGCTVYFNDASVSTTFVSSTEVRIQTPATTVGAYNLTLFNPNDGGGGIYLNLSVSNLPSWTTSAGTLGTVYEANSFSTSLVASGDGTLTYSLYSGTLPSGITLSSNGTLSGTLPSAASNTTYSFVVNVNDAQNQNSTRSFSLTINTDVVNWSSPADGTQYTLFKNSAITPVSLSASALSNQSISYTANTLPAGVSLSGNTISGTPTVAGTIYTLLTATATNSLRYSNRQVSWYTVDGVVASGGTTTTVSGYKYHTFTSGGSFTVTYGGVVDILVVAGGGGGGYDASGGGGAGGYISNQAVSIAAGTYTVTIGAGGAGATGGTGGSGSSSSFIGGSISTTATGGGGGGGKQQNGSSGGSGGGGGHNGAYTGGSGTAGQGYAGGTGYSGGGGGGGGAGEAGNTDGQRAGGDGLTWLNGTMYAGGGSAGSHTSDALQMPGGDGGGGNGGGYTTAASSGAANKGAGGGSHGNLTFAPTTNGAGGSGVVIIRYASA